MAGLNVGVQRKGLVRGRSWPFHIALTVTVLIIAFPLLYAMLISTQTNAEIFSFPNFDALVQRIITSVGILAMFRLVSGFGWQDTMAAITVPFLASATGAFLFRQHFANMPVELLEASQIDGASPFKFLTKVLIPLSWNIIAALFVIQFVYTWNMFLWPSLIVRDSSAQVVQVAMQTLLNFGSALTFGPLMLAAIIASIPPALVFVAMQKPFMSGFVISQDK